MSVQNLTASLPSPGTEGVTSVSDLVLAWIPDPRSQQDSYRIAYQEVVELSDGSVAGSAGDVTALNAADTSGVIVTSSSQFVMTTLLPGRNYSMSVISLMAGMESDPVAVYQATRKSKEANFESCVAHIWHRYLAIFLHQNGLLYRGLISQIQSAR